MKMLGETSTKGFKPTVYKNQPVHSFYGNLQAVMKLVDPKNDYSELFAKPNYAGNISQAAKIQWMTGLSGNVVPLNKLSAEMQSAICEKLIGIMGEIREFSEKRANQSGIEKDYSDFLRAIAVSAEMSNVLVADGTTPIVIHWGFIREGETDPKAAFLGWQGFVEGLKEKVQPVIAPAPPPFVEEPPVKPVVTPVETVKTEDASWWKWLLLLLLILFLLLMLRSCASAPIVPLGTSQGSDSGILPDSGSRKTTVVVVPGSPVVPGDGSGGPGSPGDSGSPGSSGGSGGPGDSGSGGNGPSVGAHGQPVVIPIVDSGTVNGKGPDQGTPVGETEPLPEVLSNAYSQVLKGSASIPFASSDNNIRWFLLTIDGQPLVSDYVYFGDKPGTHSVVGQRVTLTAVSPKDQKIDFKVMAAVADEIEQVGKYTLEPEN